MINFLKPLILLIVLMTCTFSLASTSDPIENDILLSLERIKLQNEILYNQYQNLKDLEDDISPKDNDAIIDSLAAKVLSDMESHTHYTRSSAWNKVKGLVHHIKDEAKILSRKNGLAISIIIMTIELTELPMKALAVSIGSPVLVVLYEVLQPGILIPAIIIGVKNIAKNIKTKKLFGNKELYKQWKQSEKQVKRQLGLKKGDNEISFLIEENNYVVNSSNFINDTIKIFGFYRGRLDYKNLKRYLRKNAISSTRLNSLKKSELNKQLKAKYILEELIKMGHAKKLQRRFEKAKLNLESRNLNADLTGWVVELLTSKSHEQTQYLFSNLPKSVSPLIFFELWENKIMEEFFAYNSQYKNKYYRKLQTKLLPIITQLRRHAFLNNLSPSWTPELENLVQQYFAPLAK